MSQLPRATIALLATAVAVSTAMMVWASIDDAPWESGTSGGEPTTTNAPTGDLGLPVSTRREVEDAVDGFMNCPEVVLRTDSEFLGDSTWEVTVELPSTTSGQQVSAVYRVVDGTLAVSPKNRVAERICPR